MYCVVFAAYHRLLMETYPVQNFTIPTPRHAPIGDRGSRQAQPKLEINISPTSSFVDCILASSFDTALTRLLDSKRRSVYRISPLSISLSPSSIWWYTYDLTSLLPVISSLSLHTRTFLVSLTASSTPLSSKIHEDNVDLRIEGGPPAAWARDTCVIPLNAPLAPHPRSQVTISSHTCILHFSLPPPSLTSHLPILFPRSGSPLPLGRLFPELCLCMIVESDSGRTSKRGASVSTQRNGRAFDSPQDCLQHPLASIAF